MEAYILNTNFETIKIIDDFASFIWTDRYQEYGDFEIYMPMSFDILNYLMADYYVFITSSEHLMIMEEFTIETDAEEGSCITITGRSLESLLTRRILYDSYTLNGNLEDAIATLLNDCIISPSNSKRAISNFKFVSSTDSRITELTVDTKYSMGDNLYDVVEEMCKTANVGFKVLFNSSDNDFEFSLYKGLDRSYDQFENPYVIFSPEFDNLINSNYLESYTDYKNTVLVAGANVSDSSDDRTTLTVGTTSGILRREMFLDAGTSTNKDSDNNTISDSEHMKVLKQKGNDALKDSLYTETYDGETQVYGEYAYGTDFYLGDIIQVENEWGIASTSRIVEIIISEDEDGLLIYPSFDSADDEYEEDDE
jgi:hypothetical protein